MGRSTSYTMGSRMSSRTEANENDNMLEELRRDGYVVLPQVLTENEVNEARGLLWDWLESLGSGISRHDSSTWSDVNWPGDFSTGITTSYGAAQSKAAWFVRGIPAVKEAFRRVWNTDDLITSMDSMIIWRPWWLNGESENSKPKGLRLHMDQNPFTEAGFQCLQGMVPLWPSDGDIGGLRVVPRTHLDEAQESIRNENETLKFAQRFCPVKNAKFEREWKLVEAQPGDLILFDSRLVHGSHVGIGKNPDLDDHKSPELARCAVTVCMMPRKGVPKDVLKDRLEAFKKGLCMTHLPTKYEPHSLKNTNGTNINWSFEMPKLTELQQKLV